MIRVRAGYFIVNANITNDTCALRVATWVQNNVNTPLEVTVDHQTFRLTEYAWDAGEGMFTGTMWRVRERNLPSAVREGGNEQVDSPLAESASFAYQPSQGKTLIQYNHHGPRHSVLRSMFEQMGIDEPVALSACLVQDAMQRMNNAALVRRIEYTLSGIEGVEPQLRAIPGVGETIDAMKNLDGASIRVEISLGRNPGGLAAQAKAVVSSLASLATGVRTVKAGIKETEQHAVEMLDLLGGRQIVDMNIDEVGREIDRAQLRGRLLVALRDHVTTSEDETGDEGTDAA
jgi:hypothetical protein